MALVIDPQCQRSCEVAAADAPFIRLPAATMLEQYGLSMPHPSAGVPSIARRCSASSLSRGHAAFIWSFAAVLHPVVKAVPTIAANRARRSIPEMDFIALPLYLRLAERQAQVDGCALDACATPSPHNAEDHATFREVKRFRKASLGRKLTLW